MSRDEIMSAEAAIRRALVNDIRRWEKLVREANQVCRSAYQIAQRYGADTNWDAFERQLYVALQNQHAALHPKPEPEDAP